jgi:hypothetical protein
MLTLKKGLIVDRWLLPIERTSLMVDVSKFMTGGAKSDV